MDQLEDRAVGCLAGSAVGDALGGATEGWTPAQIAERYGGLVTGIVGPYFENWREARPIAPYHKGDGHITDDTLMIHAIVRVYERLGRHLDAYDMATEVVAEMIGEKRWIPELETDGLLLQRVFLAEKWLVLRLHYGHVDPREAGTGNVVNCGAAMYIAPVGVVNAGDPDAAYLEAIDIAGAHQSSYGREAAGVLAAAVAEAMAPDGSPESVLATAARLAHDGTAAAIDAVVDCGLRFGPDADLVELAAALRAAVAPFDTVGPDYRAPALDARRPSRTKAIEELPVALGLLAATGGDYRRAVLTAVNYGRDADSIASMVGALCGALGGIEAVPAQWVEDVAASSRVDLLAPGRALAAVARTVAAADEERRLRVHSRRKLFEVATVS